MSSTQGGNGAQRREYDKKLGAGTMSRAGATCVCCGLPSMTMEDIRLEGKAGRLGAIMTAVVVDGPNGKEYRLPTGDEILPRRGGGERGRAGICGDSIRDSERAVCRARRRWASACRSTVSTNGASCSHLVSFSLLEHSLSIHATVGEQLLGQRYSAYQAEAVVAFLSMMLDRLANQKQQCLPMEPGRRKGRGDICPFRVAHYLGFRRGEPAR